MRYYYFARPDRLLLDLDGPRAWRTFQNAWVYLKDTGLFAGFYAAYRSPSGKGHHVFVGLSQKVRESPFLASNHVRSLLQALLGSDLKRERYHLRRFEREVPNPILLISFRQYQGQHVDFSCDCPKMWKGRRLRSCYHLRRDVQPGDRP